MLLLHNIFAFIFYLTYSHVLNGALLFFILYSSTLLLHRRSLGSLDSFFSVSTLRCPMLEPYGICEPVCFARTYIWLE